jgi:outer membrane lipoprotein SlyB
MQRHCRMRPSVLHTALQALLLVGLSVSCATTSTTATTWTDGPEAGPPRLGHVESVQEIVQRTEGNPAGGALVGALIGGFLFGRGPARLIGAAGGAAIGAAASQGYAERRTYQVLVRFDDGAYGMFIYGAYSPFRPGEAVALTPQGLVRR